MSEAGIKSFPQVSRLLDIMAKLRDPEDGCPWDKQQSFKTIVPYTIEEAYEVADAIEKGDMEEVKDELGDLLFQVVFYAQLGQEDGLFDFEGIAKAIADKLVRRHPHVFEPFSHLSNNADESDAIKSQELNSAQLKSEREKSNQHSSDQLKGEQQNSDQLNSGRLKREQLNNDQIKGETLINSELERNWEAIKRLERESKSGNTDTSVLANIPMGLAPLLRAQKLQKKCAKVGFDWNDLAPVLEKIQEEIVEVMDEVNQDNPNNDRIEDEIGDLLFAVVNLSRHLDIDAETALRRANRKFETRFRAVEHSLKQQKIPIDKATLAQMEAIWIEVKKRAG